MYQVIARKYRPQSFAELIGQEHVRTTLENAIEPLGLRQLELPPVGRHPHILMVPSVDPSGHPRKGD